MQKGKGLRRVYGKVIRGRRKGEIPGEGESVCWSGCTTFQPFPVVPFTISQSRNTPPPLLLRNERTIHVRNATLYTTLPLFLRQTNTHGQSRGTSRRWFISMQIGKTAEDYFASFHRSRWKLEKQVHKFHNLNLSNIHQRLFCPSSPLNRIRNY